MVTQKNRNPGQTYLPLLVSQRMWCQKVEAVHSNLHVSFGISQTMHQMIECISLLPKQIKGIAVSIGTKRSEMFTFGHAGHVVLLLSSGEIKPNEFVSYRKNLQVNNMYMKTLRAIFKHT